MTSDAKTDLDIPCSDDCPLARRAFIRGAALAAVWLALATGEDASAMTRPLVRVITGRAGRGTEKVYPVPPADAVFIDRGTDVILVRRGEHVYALSLACPHQNTALRWTQDEGGRFECPKHHSKYQADGTFVSGRATRSMDRYAIRRQANEVLVDLDRLFEQDKQPADWLGAVVTLT